MGHLQLCAVSCFYVTIYFLLLIFVYILWVVIEKTGFLVCEGGAARTIRNGLLGLRLQALHLLLCVKEHDYDPKGVKGCLQKSVLE